MVVAAVSVVVRMGAQDRVEQTEKAEGEDLPLLPPLLHSRLVVNIEPPPTPAMPPPAAMEAMDAVQSSRPPPALKLPRKDPEQAATAGVLQQLLLLQPPRPSLKLPKPLPSKGSATAAAVAAAAGVGVLLHELLQVEKCDRQPALLLLTRQPASCIWNLPLK